MLIKSQIESKQEYRWKLFLRLTTLTIMGVTRRESRNTVAIISENQGDRRMFFVHCLPWDLWSCATRQCQNLAKLFLSLFVQNRTNDSFHQNHIWAATNYRSHWKPAIRDRVALRCECLDAASKTLTYIGLIMLTRFAKIENLQHIFGVRPIHAISRRFANFIVPQRVNP